MASKFFTRNRFIFLVFRLVFPLDGVIDVFSRRKSYEHYLEYDFAETTDRLKTAAIARNAFV